MRLTPVHRVSLRLLSAVVLAAVLIPAAPAFGIEALSIYPAWVPKNTPPGSAVSTIRGMGFTPAATVTFDGTAATVIYVNSRTLQVQAPTSSVGMVARVVVANPGGGSDDLYPFIYTDKNFYVSPTGDDANAGTSPASPKRTIRGAIDDASATLTNLIRVAAGRFGDNALPLPTGTALAGGFNSTFTARDVDMFVSEVDAAGFGFNLRSFGLDAKVVVDGLTFVGGFRDGAGGGALEFVGDQVALSNNVIVGAISSTMGGGIYLGFTTSYGGKVSISNNVIIGNRSHAAAGGGVVIYPFYTSGNLVDVAISDNYIAGNRSYLSRGGGLALQTNAFYGYNQVNLEVAGNFIVGNSAKAGAGVNLGLTTHTDEVNLLADNNVIAMNKTTGNGGGVTVGGTGGLKGWITGSTIASNTAGIGSAAGLTISPGVTVDPSFAPKDLILWGNVSDDAGGAVSLSYSDTGGGVMPGSGNISGDPRFVKGLHGKFYLQQNDPNLPVSAAVDVGSDTASATGKDGLTTATDGSADSGMVDMGAHFEPAPADSPDPIQLTRLDPDSGDVGGSDWVLLRGTGFDPGARAYFGSTESPNTIYISSTRILAQPVVHGAGTVGVTVTNPDNTSDIMVGAYRYLDNTPPVWLSTVGAQIAQSPADCVRSVIVDWNEAVDALTPPVKYEVYKFQCTPAPGSVPPCTNYFDFIPVAANRVATTSEMSYIDTAFTASGADPQFLYIVRAIDAVNPVNRELNFSKRLATATKNTGDTTPPAAVGDTLDVSLTSLFDWAFSRGAVAYRLYRQTNASTYATPGSLTPLITLNVSNNDLNGDGFVDTQYTDATVPLPAQAFFYKVSALDPCNVETIATDVAP